MVFRLKNLTIGIATLALVACSSGHDSYDDSYGYDSYSGGYGYGGANAYGAGYGGQAGYGMMGGYGMGGMGMNCMPMGGGMSYGGYGGGYTQGGLRTGRYGNPVVATGNVEFYGKKSRYGSYQQSSAGNAGCMSGYWTVPTYQVIQQPPAAVTTTPAPAPIVTTVQETCPDGQYRMDNGDCAIMINDETEQYVPPVTSYPTVTAPTVDWYEPVRK